MFVVYDRVREWFSIDCAHSLENLGVVRETFDVANHLIKKLLSVRSDAALDVFQDQVAFVSQSGDSNWLAACGDL